MLGTIEKIEEKKRGIGRYMGCNNKYLSMM
jgi:hypothetical protein